MFAYSFFKKCLSYTALLGPLKKYDLFIFDFQNLLKTMPMVLTIVALKGIVKASFSCGPDFQGTN